MKIFSCFALTILVMLSGRSGAIASPLAGGDDDLLNYHWSFAAKVGTGDARRLTTISRDTLLRSGDEVKMMVHLKSRAYVYVLNKTSKQEIALLYPYTIEAPLELGKNLYIPKGRGWFKLDNNTGEETFYILASKERLSDLETKLHDYLNADPERKKNAAAAIVAEIKNLKKKHRLYAAVAERPISIAGNVRGTKATPVPIDRVDIATLATEIIAPNFYSKTITIEHK